MYRKASSKKIGADNTTVLKYLQRKGIYQSFEGYKKFYKEWEERCNCGESWGEIAKDYDCCPQTVLHHLQMKKLI